MNQKMIDGILVTKPTRADVENLRVGDLAPDCFGKMAEVTEIFGQKDNIRGEAFVCYYTKLDENSTISGSMTENEIVSTIPVTSKWNRAELVPFNQEAR